MSSVKDACPEKRKVRKHKACEFFFCWDFLIPQTILESSVTFFKNIVQ